jgi:putative sigma-54 modulation protein
LKFGTKEEFMAMNIQITSRHAKASPSLQATITKDLMKLEKFSDKITSCHVVLDTEGVDKRVEVVVTVRGQMVKAEGQGDNLGKAVDLAVQKIERQLKKMNEKVKNHKGKLEPEMAVEAEPEAEY